MLLLERQREAVDDAAQNLQQLRDAVVVLGLKDEAVEHIVDGLAHEGPVHHELAVHAVQDGLQVVALARVLAVKELQQLQHKVLVDVLLGHLGVRVVGHHVAQQKLVHDLGRECGSSSGSSEAQHK